MTEHTVYSSLALPALRAHMGDWIYYICYMKMRDISERISLAKEIHSSTTLQHLLQRQLTNRSSEIAAYLVTQKQRFFNAIVVGTYGGNPKWTEFSIRTTSSQEQYSLINLIDNGSLGILMMSGEEKLFAIDGQHRIAGIRKALNVEKGLGDEEVCVIFVAGVTQENRSKHKEGFERTRRLFTTLNRYAKPVSKKDIIALDEDDVIAIITRRLVEEYPLFTDNRISLKETKGIPVTDKISLTTIVMLYDAMDFYLRQRAQGWSNFKKFRPKDDEINELYRNSKKLWDILAKNIAPLKELLDSDPGEEIAGKYRNNQGGHLFFRPVGLLLCIKTIKLLIDSKMNLSTAVSRLVNAPMEISKEPWVGLLWDLTNQRMITSSENQKAALKLLFHAVGGDLAVVKSSTEKLRKELSGILNIELSEVKIPRYVK